MLDLLTVDVARTLVSAAPRLVSRRFSKHVPKRQVDAERPVAFILLLAVG